MTDTPAVARVEIKSAWLSKINWVQIGQAITTLLTTNAFGFDDHTQVLVLSGTTLATNLATIVFKTYFTPTVTPASLTSVKE